MILAGDIGGTNTRLALFNDDLTARRMEKYPSADYALDDALDVFLSGERRKPAAACFAVAGPVVGGIAKITNLRWAVDATALAHQLKLKPARVRLINDMHANAAGIESLRPRDLVILNRGKNRPGNRALLSPGTGLGVGGLYWDGQTHRPLACEGGHVSFGPRTDMEMQLARYLRDRDPQGIFRGHVSWERILSGPGLVNIYQYLTSANISACSPDVQAKMESDDPAAVISEAALAGICPRSMQALDIFVGLCGAAAGNVALMFLAVGGMYIGGGIAPRIVERFKGPEFLRSFLEKGPMRRILEDIPVRLILNDRTALLGAARVAASLR